MRVRSMQALARSRTSKLNACVSLVATTGNLLELTLSNLPCLQLSRLNHRLTHHALVAVPDHGPNSLHQDPTAATSA